MACMRILHLVKSKNYAGSEQTMLTLCELLKDAGHEVFIATSYGRILNQLCKERGFKVVPVDLVAPFAASKLAKFVKEQHIDIVHSYLTGGARIANKLHKKCGLPAFAHLLVTREHPVFSELGHRGSLIAVCQFIADFYIGKYGIPHEKIPIVHNISIIPKSELEDKPKSELRKWLNAEFSLPEDSKVIAMVGRLSDGKGQDVLIEAIPAVLEVHPDTHILMVGKAKSGSKKENELRTLVKEKGLENYIHFTGFRRDVGNIIRACDINCVPSRYDILPLTLIEGMHMGTPLVASHVGGIPEVLHHSKNALLFENENPLDLAAQITHLLNDSKLAATLTQNAKTTVTTTLSPQTILQQVISLYEAALS